MKINFKTIALLACAGFVLASCEGPAGPAGVDGIDGTNGTNGTAGCIECHDNSATILAKSEQYEHSLHGFGEESAYTNGRTSGSCQKCHSNQGFHEFLKGAAGNVHQSFEDIQQPNCYTCHNIHKTYTSADYGLTTTAAVVFMNGIGGPYNNTNEGGGGNLCANCHQSIVANPALPTVGTGNLTLSSSQTRWGPHYSAVSNIMTNTGGYHITGALAYTTNHAHKSVSCVTCHMAKPYGAVAGGHTMAFRYDSHGSEAFLNTGCTACHTETASAFLTKNNNSRAATQALIDELKAELIRVGIYNSTTSLANAGTYPADVAGAYWNYKVAVGDANDQGGLYAHNPPYTKALLQNSIDAMKLLPTP